MFEINLFSSQKEKKVEYLELVYDLIFVYIIGRNNSLLHHTENGFVSWKTFLAYAVCTLAIIQIWTFSTFYINLYGRNSTRDHVFLFVNMFLLYHMADGISTRWETSFYRFNLAWALILVNLGVQYLIERRKHLAAPWEVRQIDRKAMILFAEAVLVIVHMFVYDFWGVSVAYIPIMFGAIFVGASDRINKMVPVDFDHLTERIMLYVVFTFGEMIISVAAYFSGEVTFGSIYFSTMGFLIVVALLLSYGTFYNKILDREKTTNGTVYMMIHVFLIFVLNNISVSLEFMREEDVSVLPKMLFLTVSFLIYYACLFSLGAYSKRNCGFAGAQYLAITLLAAAFIGLMVVFRDNMYLNIALTVVFTFAVFCLIYFKSRKTEQPE
ncbi:MAG: low temperature requirement protein A [Clostridia bacterium]|nr:low temperature requirement protein A [Clostridia bacterium]